MRVDVHELDAEFLGPEAARRALEPRIGAVGAFGIAGPEDDHLGFLEAVLDPAVARRHADAHRIAEMVHGAPVPALPAVRVGGDPGEADQVGEAHQRAEVIAHVAPLVMGRHREGDRARPVHALLPVDLLGDDVQRLVPADAHVAGLAAVLGIALAVGIEVHPLHRDEGCACPNRPATSCVRACGATRARRGGLNLRPRASITQVAGSVSSNSMRRDPQDPAVLDVDEQGAAIGAGGVAAAAVGHGRAHRQAGGLAHVEGLREPDHQRRPARRSPP